MSDHLIMKGISGLYIMFVNMMSISLCKLKNRLISFFHMIGLVASLTMGTGRNLFDTNLFLRKR